MDMMTDSESGSGRSPSGERGLKLVCHDSFFRLLQVAPHPGSVD